MSVRFRLCLLAWIAVVAVSKLAGAEVFEFDSGFKMEITPAEKLPLADEAAEAAADGDEAVDAEKCGHQVAAKAQAYKKIYDAIPFNRAEYNVNPSYRHDTTMELLTGNARHQTTVQHITPRLPVRRTGPINAIPYRYNNPNYGLNYYFYFPYWNARGIY
ncbi:MAG: hypothetical protein R3C19_13855 [Planctomycetaceae bacterium]